MPGLHTYRSGPATFVALYFTLTGSPGRGLPVRVDICQCIRVPVWQDVRGWFFGDIDQIKLVKNLTL